MQLISIAVSVKQQTPKQPVFVHKTPRLVSDCSPDDWHTAGILAHAHNYMERMNVR